MRAEWPWYLLVGVGAYTFQLVLMIQFYRALHDKIIEQSALGRLRNNVFSNLLCKLEKIITRKEVIM